MSKVSSGWDTLAEDRLVVFPSNSAFASGPLSAAGKEERLLFGLAARLLKDGHSMALTLPCPDKSFFANLLYYLHRVRVDAMGGYVLGSWFHPEALWMRRDLVWFGKPLHLTGSLSKVRNINPCRLTRKKGQAPTLMGRSAKVARTPLLPWSGDSYQLQELLVGQTDPFAFIVDATPTGVRDDLQALWEVLSVYFPDVPVLAVSALGDFETDRTIDQMPLHRWFHRLQDRQIWSGESQIPPQQLVNLVEIPDTVLDSRLGELYQQVYNLNRQFDGESHQAREGVVRTAFRLVQRLSSLSCPLALREKYLEQNSRRGPFAVRSLAREVDILNNTPLRYGTLENQRKTLVDGFSKLLKLLESGTSGKTQYLHQVVKRVKKEEKSLLVLVGDSHDEKAITEAINDFGLGLVDFQRLNVRTVSGVRSAAGLSQFYDQCLILCRLWDRDVWWLTDAAKQVIWPVYPFERPWVLKRLEIFRSHCIQASLPQGDKKTLVTLSWRRKAILLDRDTEKASLPISSVIEKDCSGQYPIEKPVAIDRPADLEEWLTEILSAEPSVEDYIPNERPEVGDCAFIKLEERSGSFLWPVNSSLPVLNPSTKEGFTHKAVEELQPGDQFVWIEGGDPYGEILHNLFEVFHDSPETQEILRWVRYWDQIVENAVRKFPVPQLLHQALEKEGTRVTLTTVYNWLNKKVYGPDRESSVRNLATLAGSPSLAKCAPQIHQAVSRVWTEHRQIGKDLRQALINRAAGATSVRIGSLELEVQTLDDILRIYTVVSVSLPDAAPATPKCLADLVPRVQAEFGERIMLIPKAVRSMEDSPYRDLDKAWECFSLSNEYLWGHLNGGVPFNDMREKFRHVGIDVKPGTSEITQGMSSDYIALYEGKPVDMGPHLSLGTARDPSKTLRVHYHWDEAKQLLVILHAGRHLKTRSS
ncbi:MAG: DrmE family protein [Desulfuromonadales bacterium]